MGEYNITKIIAPSYDISYDKLVDFCPNIEHLEARRFSFSGIKNLKLTKLKYLYLHDQIWDRFTIK
jgi:hypothetical protein